MAPQPAEVTEAQENVVKSDHDDELNMRERFTLKETFQGEELEAVYMVARKPVSVDPNVDFFGGFRRSDGTYGTGILSSF